MMGKEEFIGKICSIWLHMTLTNYLKYYIIITPTLKGK